MLKFTCERYLLAQAIGTASRCAAAKSPIPALEGLLIEAGHDVCVTGYDLKKGIYTRFAADVTTPGSVVLSARLFGDIIRSLPEGLVTVEADKNHLTRITCENADFSIMGTDPEEYPQLPEVDSQSTIAVAQGTLRQMIGQTLFAVSDNETRMVYTGSLFEIENGSLTIVSVDGYRLALRREQAAETALDTCSFIVPGSALSDLEKICQDSEEPVRITLGSKHISFAIGGTVLVSRRLEGEFLNYKKSVPTQFGVQVTAQRSELIRVVDRVSLIIDDKIKNPLRCTFGDDEIRFLCVTSRGKAEDLCPVKGSGNGLEIGFNNRYLLDSLKAAPAEELRLCLNSGSSPCVIVPEDGKDNFLYMVLPVRLKAGD